MDLFLLLVVTAVYFIRPAEWIPAVAGMPLFAITIIPCFVASIGKWPRRLSGGHLGAFPISACVLFLQVTVLICEVLNLASLDQTIAFSKACAFYLLVVAILDNKKSLVVFVKGLGCALFVMGSLILLADRGYLSGSGEEAELPSEAVASDAAKLRVGALGGANFDANDTAALLVLALLICLHYVIEDRSLVLKASWLGIAFVLVIVMKLTNSRGGFLALLCGLGVYVISRWGRRGVVWGAGILPLVVVALATDRMLSVQSAFENDTGQSRVQLWNDALAYFLEHPILGTGPDSLVNHMGKAVHNSFIQAYGELGIVGGTLFISTFAYGGYSCFRLARSRLLARADGVRTDATVCLVFAILTAYAVAITALNHLYSAHTLLVLGVTCALGCICDFRNRLSAASLSGIFILVSATFLLSMIVVTRLLVRWA